MFHCCDVLFTHLQGSSCYSVFRLHVPCLILRNFAKSTRIVDKKLQSSGPTITCCMRHAILCFSSCQSYTWIWKFCVIKKGIKQTPELVNHCIDIVNLFSAVDFWWDLFSFLTVYCVCLCPNSDLLMDDIEIFFFVV